jgi:hypothetical protein
VPQAPELEISTDMLAPAECVACLIDYAERAFRAGGVRRLAS